MSTTAVKFEDFDATVSMEYDMAASLYCDSPYWRVTIPFRYFFNDPSGNKYVEVPLGYISNGASVPRVFWDLLPPWGSYGQAAVLHDYLCENLLIMENGVPTTITRRAADDALKDACAALGVARWKRNLIFIGVVVYVFVFRIKGKRIAAAKQQFIDAHPNYYADAPSPP